jgi:formylglycine-generating enzyme required for sulfatase activity
VAIPGLALCVDRYEAARLDATSTRPGTSATPRSFAGVLPWAQVGQAAAASACASASKRLCTAAEWTAACGAAGSTYPYGNVYNGQVCATGDHLPAFDAAQPTGSLVSCHGGVAGLYDMAGNLAEWVSDLFQGGAVVKGSSYRTGPGDSACQASQTKSASTEDAALGFRCCRAGL